MWIFYVYRLWRQRQQLFDRIRMPECLRLAKYFDLIIFINWSQVINSIFLAICEVGEPLMKGRMPVSCSKENRCEGPYRCTQVNGHSYCCPCPCKLFWNGHQSKFDCSSVFQSPHANYHQIRGWLVTLSPVTWCGTLTRQQPLVKHSDIPAAKATIIATHQKLNAVIIVIRVSDSSTSSTLVQQVEALPYFSSLLSWPTTDGRWEPTTPILWLQQSLPSWLWMSETKPQLHGNEQFVLSNCRFVSVYLPITKWLQSL